MDDGPAGLPALPPGHRGPSVRGGAAAHLRASLPRDALRVPRIGGGLRDRPGLRGRAAPDRLRVRDRRGPRAPRGRPHRHPHPWDPAVPAGGGARGAAIPHRGPRRVRVVGAPEDLPYPTGTVEWLDDKPEQADPATAEAAHEAYANL